MPSLMAFFGLDASKFKAGLDKSVAEAQKTAPTIEKSLIGGLKSSRIFQAIASPIGMAASAAVGFVGMIISKVDELRERAKEIKIGAAQTGLSQGDYQDVMGAAKATGAPIEALPKAILKIAEAQEKVKSGGEGADKALQAFSNVGVTLKDLESKNPQEIFLKVAEAMHVAKLSGEQMTAGAEIMGKGFESLVPAFQRGFNDPVDQMGKLTDDEITRLNRMNRTVSILKSTWSTAMQSLANGASSVLGFGDDKKYGDDEGDIKQQKKLQAIIDERKAKEANAANSDRQNELAIESANEKNTKEAAAIDERTKAEEKAAHLRAMPAGQRLGELKKETDELKRQAAILEEKLKHEADAADAVPLAKIKAEIAKNQLSMAELSNKPDHDKLSLTANQRVGAYAGAGVQDKHLAVAQKMEQHLVRIATYNEQLIEQWNRLHQHGNNYD